jgi:hypothetical protein
MKAPISVIWLIFALLFLALSGVHWSMSKSVIPAFERTKRPAEDHMRTQISGMDVDEPLDSFVSDFNEYVSVENAVSRKANRMSAGGYLMAALTAFFSMCLASRRKDEDRQ